MTVSALVNTALSAVLANTWAKELPPVPVWPAMVFEIDSTPEENWCAGGGYTQHEVHIVALAVDLQTLEALLPLDGGGTVIAALEALQPQYMFEVERGDADYEDDPRVYARYLTAKLRTRRT